MADVLLDAQQVSFQYDSGDPSLGSAPSKEVLKCLDLQIERGSFVALLGHNGCGKSTLAKHFNAMLLPTGGRVLVNGIDTADEEKRLDVRRTVGMILQNPDNQLVSTIVEEDVAFGPENLGIEPQEIRRRVDEALKTVGMYDYRTHASYKLSGGQKQRIAIAGILAMQPDCVVLDEPTAMLDPQGRAEVMDTIERLTARDRYGRRRDAARRHAARGVFPCGNAAQGGAGCAAADRALLALAAAWLVAADGYFDGGRVRGRTCPFDGGNACPYLKYDN
jgi:energy-coupling factor transport system ATP-binding protein